MEESEPKYDHRNCKGCLNPFTPKRKHQKYCKSSCRYRIYNSKRGRLSGSNVIDWLEQHLITVTQASQLSNVPPSTIRSRAKRGKLKYQKLGGRYFVYKSDFMAATTQA